MFGPLSLHNIMPGWVANIVQGTAILGAGLLAALYAFQEKILYVPVLPGVPNTYDETPLDHGIEYSEDWITSADGTRLQCWFVKAPGGAATPPPVILFFQENAGNMSHRTSFIVALARRMRCAVFVLGYRGYGKSEGTPGQVGFEADALAALQHVQKRADVDTRRIVLFGRSLGGAVALHLAAGREGAIKAAIVENTFTSVGDMVPKVLPFLGPALRPQMPLNWLIRNQWRNAERIAELKSLPLLLIASKRDEVVPFAQMRKLRELSAVPTTWCECPSSGHMDAFVRDETVYWRAMRDFWATKVTPGLAEAGFARLS